VVGAADDVVEAEAEGDVVEGAGEGDGVAVDLWLLLVSRWKEGSSGVFLLLSNSH
jgi:hypothetical protein